MPDDAILINEEDTVAEPTDVELEAEAAFNEALSPESEQKTEEPKEEPEEPSETESSEESEEEHEEQAPEKPPKNVDEKKKEEGAEEKEKTPLDFIEERYKEIDQEGKKEVKTGLDAEIAEAQEKLEQLKAQAAEHEKAMGRGGPPSLSKEDIGVLLSMFDPASMPDGPITVGNTQIDLKSFAEEDPDAFNAMRVMAGAMADRMIRAYDSNRKYVTTDQVQELQNRYDATIKQMEFELAVSRKHPDMHELIESDENGKPANEKSADFVSWLNTQSKATKWAAYQSTDPRDAIRVIDAYKEDQAKKAVAEHDKNAADKKAKKDAVLQHNIRNKPTVTMPRTDLDDFEAGFNEVAGGRR